MESTETHIILNRQWNLSTPKLESAFRHPSWLTVVDLTSGESTGSRKIRSNDIYINFKDPRHSRHSEIVCNAIPICLKMKTRERAHDEANVGAKRGGDASTWIWWKRLIFHYSGVVVGCGGWILIFSMWEYCARASHERCWMSKSSWITATSNCKCLPLHRGISTLLWLLHVTI